MDKPLSAVILFLLSIVLLYLGGVSKGAIGASMAVGGLVCFVAAIISGIRDITKRGKKVSNVAASSDSRIVSKSRSSKYAHLEKKKGWRVAKVAYWLLIASVIVFSLFHVDYYENSDMQGFAIFILLICFPLYLTYRKMAFYIVSGE